MTAKRTWLEVLGVWAITAVAIRIAVAIGNDVVISVVKVAALIYLPLALVWRRNEDPARYGLHLREPGRALALFAVVSLATLPAFWLANHLWETRVLHHRLHFAWPKDLGSVALGELFAVALPEEFFYRGWLQTRLESVLPPATTVLGARVGWFLPAASLVFVAGHLAVRPALWQLGIFFPSMVFGWMRLRQPQSIAAPVLYHALCNLGMHVLLDPRHPVYW